MNRMTRIMLIKEPEAASKADCCSLKGRKITKLMAINGYDLLDNV